MNTIVEKDCLTFKDIEKEIFKYVCQIAVDLTKEFLAEYDRKLMQERDTAKYRHKGYKDDHIRCVYGDVPYVLSGELNDAPSGRLFRADFRILQMCQSL